MEHKESINTDAAERYLLDEMTPEERFAFEDHYFGCVECAEAVQLGSTIGDSVRAIARADKVFRRPTKVVVPWLAAAASATIAVFLGFQQFAPGAATAIRATTTAPPAIEVASYRELSNDVRAGVTAPTELPANRTAVVPVDIPAGDYTSYLCQLRKGGQVIDKPMTISPAEIKDPVFVLIRPLPAGQYELVVQGVRKDGNRSDIHRYALTVHS